MSFFLHLASELGRSLFSSHCSHALHTLASHLKYVSVSPLNHVLLLFDFVPCVCNMAFMFDTVYLILLPVEVLQYMRFLLWCFIRAHICSNVKPGGKGSFCRHIVSCSISSCPCFFLSFKLAAPCLVRCLLLIGSRSCSLGLSILQLRGRMFTLFCVVVLKVNYSLQVKFDFF